LVGKNNSGKSSWLKLLDWVYSIDTPISGQKNSLDYHDLALLLPARKTRNRARRLTLFVAVGHEASRKKFRCRAGVAELRFNIRTSPSPFVYISIGRARRSEATVNEKNALELLHRLRDSHRFVYVPAVRDPASKRLSRKIVDALSNELIDKGTHSVQGGAPQQARVTRQAITDLRRAVSDIARPFWSGVGEQLPAGFIRSSNVQMDLDDESVLAWIAQSLRLMVSTGPHDIAGVDLPELGSGLQSLLEIALEEVLSGRSDALLTLMIDEPESFLHPSAQRKVARALAPKSTRRRSLICTHSPIVAQEMGFAGLRVARDHKVFEHSVKAGSKREAINSGLLRAGAETLFSRSVLLVEGEGDRQFYETLRRRLQPQDTSGVLDDLSIVSVGGKAGYAPWVRLYDAFRRDGDRPIEWLVVADADAVGEVFAALRHASYEVPQAALEGQRMLDAIEEEDRTLVRVAVDRINMGLESAGIRVVFQVYDLEYVALAAASESVVEVIESSAEDELGPPSGDVDRLMRRLGSKALGRNEDAVKAPWLRSVVAGALDWKSVHPVVRRALRLWLAPSVTSTHARRRILGRLKFE
jgi:predicted ATP-dependent endonuclease of OLD family